MASSSVVTFLEPVDRAVGGGNADQRSVLNRLGQGESNMSCFGAGY